MATCLVLGHDFSDVDGRPEDGTYGWRACACNGSLPAHSWGDDPADGRGCGMAWRLCRFCDHIDEIPLTELNDQHDIEHDGGAAIGTAAEVQPGGSFRQDVAAGLALPNRRKSA